MTDVTDETGDPRRPQGSWPLIWFLLGLVAVALVTCQSQTPNGAAKAPASVSVPAAPSASAGAKADGAAKAEAAAPVKAPLVSVPTDLSDEAKRILAALGASPNASACQDGFKQLMRRERVGFAHNSIDLGPKAQKTLTGAAAIAHACAAHKIEIGGHTDRSGARAVNQRISEARANAVRDFLLANGAPAASVTAKGYGESQILYSGKGYRGARNRRIGFTVSD